MLKKIVAIGAVVACGALTSDGAAATEWRGPNYNAREVRECLSRCIEQEQSVEISIYREETARAIWECVDRCKRQTEMNPWARPLSPRPSSTSR